MRSRALRFGVLTAASTLGLFATVTCGGSVDLTFTGEGGEGGEGGQGGQDGAAGEGGLGGSGGASGGSGGSSGGGPSSGGASTGGDGSGGDGSGGDGSGGDGSGGDGSGGGPGVCGDGEVGGSEECDQSDLDGQDCTSRGYALGRLACDANCDFDESDCFSFDHVFTSCGVSGQQGPTIDDCRAAYDTDWDEDDTQFGMGSQGYQLWVVPIDGTYRIEAFGAQGGSFDAAFQGGLGARIQGDFPLLAGSAVALVVGQMGNGSGGGGGTFVSDVNGNPFVVAGGGSGASASVGNGAPGRTTLDGTGIGGIPDTSNCGAAGGGGFFEVGGSLPYDYATGGGSYYGTGSALGGNGSDCYGDFTINWGGFGGGGGGGHVDNGGGGGGYDGGAGQWRGIGTGGTSYNAGANQEATEGFQAGHGQVRITLLTP